ncbi:MAG: DUF2516 family protein [Rothia sp. (in: high G+C Gram-positive bacteria)]|nr:DUF2516 family protein [Rothia sp. (in: high G+C Gram-positive bacteria)]
MSPVDLIDTFTVLSVRVFSAVVFVMSVWALFEALRASAYAYQSAFKRSKTFWVSVTAACTVFSALACFTGYNSVLTQLAAAVAAGVFMADVRPAVSTRR